MKIDIGVFNLLSGIAKHHGISDVEWAEASQIRRPTIPELRRINRAINRGVKDTGIKRDCTMEKILKLCIGLRIKVGSTILNKMLIDSIDIELNQDMRLLFLILIGNDTSPEIKDEIEAMLKPLLITPLTSLTLVGAWEKTALTSTEVQCKTID